jgi:cysteine desulfurase family protein (TIGR01976 family)
MALILPSRARPVVPIEVNEAAPTVTGMTTATVAGYDVGSIRSRYPALGDGWAYLDGAAGTQVPRAVIEAESAAYTAGIGNHGGAFAASRRSDALTAAARAAVADLLGAASSSDVVLGPSTTALVYRFAEALARTWRAGDEIVLTRLDHDANVRPWVQAAGRTQVLVRWADPVLPSLDLPPEAVAARLGPRTRLVAVTGASNVVGTRPDIRAIADAAHAVGALLFVDGVHATPHTAVDVVALGADFWATSAYKWSGPHLAAVAGRPELLDGLHPDKLDSVADVVPDRFERGTPPFAQHAGLAAAVDHLAGLVATEHPAATLRQRIVASMAAVEAHEAELLSRLLDGIATMPHVHRIGSPQRQAPTVWFHVDGYQPSAVAEHCARARINVWSGHNYAWELAGLLGIRNTGSAVRAGMSCYTDETDVDRLLEALADLRQRA